MKHIFDTQIIVCVTLIWNVIFEVRVVYPPSN